MRFEGTSFPSACSLSFFAQPHLSSLKQLRCASIQRIATGATALRSVCSRVVAPTAVNFSKGREIDQVGFLYPSASTPTAPVLFLAPNPFSHCVKNRSRDGFGSYPNSCEGCYFSWAGINASLSHSIDSSDGQCVNTGQGRNQPKLLGQKSCETLPRRSSKSELTKTARVTASSLRLHFRRDGIRYP